MDMSEDSNNNDSDSDTEESKSGTPGSNSTRLKEDSLRDRDYRREDRDYRREDRDYRKEDVDYRKQDKDYRIKNDLSKSRIRDKKYDNKDRNSRRDRSPTEGRSPRRSSGDRHSSRRSSNDNSLRKGLGERRTPDRSQQDVDDRHSSKVPSLMELKPFGGEPPPDSLTLASGQRDKDSDSRSDKDKDGRRDRNGDRDRDRNGDRDRDRDRDRKDRRDRDRDRDSDRDRYRRRDDDRHRRRSRSRSRDRSREKERERDRGSKRSSESRDKDKGNSRQRSGSRERRHSRGSTSPSGDYRPSYKVSKKLLVMEKMGLQIKTPDGSMATAQMLMQRGAAEQRTANPNSSLPSYYNPSAVNAARYADQVQKRKLLWGNKSKDPAAPVVEAAVVTQPPPSANPNISKWTGARFSQDSDGKVVNKFMRLMGIKDPGVTQQAATASAEEAGPTDVVKKQEEMFQAMQAQYDVARATTHTMRGVGLGFSSSGFKF